VKMSPVMLADSFRILQLSGQATAVGLRTLIWSLDGDQGKDWKDAHVTINSPVNRYRIDIEGIRGSTFYGDIGIDDIAFSQGSCGKG